MKIQDNDNLDFILANKNGKWGLLNGHDGSIVVPFEYDSMEDVPTDLTDSTFK